MEEQRTFEVERIMTSQSMAYWNQVRHYSLENMQILWWQYFVKWKVKIWF